MVSTSNIRIRTTQNAVCRKIGDTHYLVPISGDLASTGYTVKLNDLGAILWSEISTNDEVTLRDLVTLTTSEYKVTEAIAINDIRAFLDTLTNIGIVTMNSGLD